MLVELDMDIHMSAGGVARFLAAQSPWRRASAEEGPACASPEVIFEVVALQPALEERRGLARAVLAELCMLGDSMEEDGGTAAEGAAGEDVLGEPSCPGPVTG
ncbi:MULTISPECIES: hypothetical protein [unclassified Streptomyces]|uniref:hypothetical protein n=1 Tax=unclassified Streptomyces TaxID=2593676 RepID=UPI002272032A|nr:MULTISPECIES: hypothetical protein [unclassified Streptomyces]MCY0923549.1 hypothetical protein [Streptomyces sp. H27-G5]MCY0962681.1 hypothetical protein [Streptomyces sp. H27-H5]